MKRKTQIIVVAAILAIVTIFIFTVYALNPALMNDKTVVGTDVKFENETSTAYIKDTSQGLEIYNSPKMRLTAETVEVEESLSKSASKVIELTAEVFPSFAKNKLVDWSVDWVELSSSASRGSADDYVAVESLSDGSTTAHIYSIKPFDKEIKITVTSRDNPAATAYCIVDYGERYAKDFQLFFKNNTGIVNLSYLKPSITAKFEPLILEWGEYSESDHPYDNEFSVFPTYEYHTVSSSFEKYVIKVKPSDEFYNSLKSKGLAKDVNDWTVIGSDGSAIVEELYNGLCNQDVISSDYESVDFALCELFDSAIFETSVGTHYFEVFVSAENDFDYKEYIYYLNFNLDSNVFKASGVEITEENIVL